MIRRFHLMRALKYAYFVSIALLLPVQKPLFSMNVIMFDYVNALFIGLFLIYYVVNRTIEIRLVFPWLVILVASLVSMINSGDIPLNVLTLTQELYLYVCFIVMSNVIREEREMKVFVGVLSVSAAVFSIPLLKELAANFTGRAEGLFTDDNGAAGYLGVSAFLAYYPFPLVGRILKPFFLALVLGGVFATKSISGAVSYLGGTATIFAMYWRSMGARTRVRLAVIGVAVAFLLVAVFQVAAQQHNYLDRLPGSEEGRQSLWKAGLRTFAGNPLGIGIGPAGFKDAVIVPEWSHRKELHSDYLAFLVERGILGFLGLLLILGSMARSLARTLKNRTSEQELLWILGLVGMFVFTMIDAINHETLHNRQVWMIYALIVAQERISKNLKRKALAARPSWSQPDSTRARETSLELV